MFFEGKGLSVWCKLFPFLFAIDKRFQYLCNEIFIKTKDDNAAFAR